MSAVQHPPKELIGSNVVDYAAWNKGYTPPAEHVLIDRLAHRGAKVILGSGCSKREYWLVTMGDINLRGKAGLAIMKTIELTIDAEGNTEDAYHPLAAENELAHGGVAS